MLIYCYFAIIWTQAITNSVDAVFTHVCWHYSYIWCQGWITEWKCTSHGCFTYALSTNQCENVHQKADILGDTGVKKSICPWIGEKGKHRYVSEFIVTLWFILILTYSTAISFGCLIILPEFGPQLPIHKWGQEKSRWYSPWPLWPCFSLC